MDPVTAVAAASTAFSVIKKGFQVGRDIESMGADLGRWMTACSDIKKAEEYSKKPPLFKKLSRPWMFISSKVSTQSDAKPGHITNKFFMPLLGRLSSVLSV